MHFNIENFTYVVNEGDGHQLVQQGGNQQQGNVVGGDQTRAQQTAIEGPQTPSSRSGWILIGIAFVLALVFTGLGIAGIVPWEWAGGGAIAVLTVAAVVKFN